MYCCANSDAYVDLDIETQSIIGEYSTNLSDEFGLIFIGGDKRIKGVNITTDSRFTPTPFTVRRVRVSYKVSGKVPYCKAHLNKSSKNEFREALNRGGPGWATFILIGGWLYFVDGMDWLVSGVMAAVSGFIVYLITILFRRKILTKFNTAKQSEFFQSSLLNSIQGDLGWKCNPHLPEISDIRTYLSDPKIFADFEFSNEDYARNFVDANPSDVPRVGTETSTSRPKQSPWG